MDPNTLSQTGDIEETAVEPARKSTWKTWAIRLLITALILVVALVGGLFWLWKLANSEPEFYSKILRENRQQQQAHGAQFETRILDMRNSMQLSDDWSLTVTDNQINGWLATDAAKNFPDLFPPQISDPRVVIEDQDVTIAFRCSIKPFNGVAVLRGQIFLTDVLNKIGIRVHSIHSGALPIPVATISAQIAAAAKDSDIELDWEMGGEHPVALIAMPDEMVNLGNGNYLELKAINFSKNQVEVIGRSHEATDQESDEDKDEDEVS